MVRSVAVRVVLMLPFLGASAHATQFPPYRERIVADPGGRYYVVVKQRNKSPDGSDGPVTLTIAERRPGSPPVRSSSTTPYPYDPKAVRGPDASIRIRDGDIVHGRVDLDEPPADILVSTTGQGIVTLDVYGFNGSDDPGKIDVAVYDLDGTPLHLHKRRELFDNQTRLSFRDWDGLLFWCKAWWLDEKRGDIVIVGYPGGQQDAPPILAIGFRSGIVRKAGNEVFASAISERNLPALEPALRLVLALKIRDAQESLRGLLKDESVALGYRLKGALALASLGDHQGADLFTKTARLATEADRSRPDVKKSAAVGYAIHNLPDLLGEAALPILKQTLQQSGRAYYGEHGYAFRKLGKKAVPTLISILEDDRFHEAQCNAAASLALIGREADAAVPALIKALHMPRGSDSGSLPSAAARALGYIGHAAKSAVPHLEQLSKEGDDQSRQSADYALKAIAENSPSP